MGLGIGSYEGVVGKIIGIFVVVTLVAALAGTYFGGLNDLFTAFNASGLDNATAAAIVAVLAIVVVILGALALVSVVTKAFGRN